MSSSQLDDKIRQRVSHGHYTLPSSRVVLTSWAGRRKTSSARPVSQAASLVVAPSSSGSESPGTTSRSIT
jgi:hypothetical protein